MVPIETQSFLYQELPELPWVRRQRFIQNYKLEPKKVLLFIKNIELGDFFEVLVKTSIESINNIEQNQNIIELCYNYLTVDFLGLIAKENKTFSKDLLNPNNFALLIKYLIENKISSKGAKIIIENLVRDPNLNTEDILNNNNLLQVSDENFVVELVQKVLVDNSSSVQEYKNGKESVLQFLIGQAMKASKGTANPQIVKEIMLKLLG